MTDIEEYEEEDYESDLKKELLTKMKKPKQLKPCPFCGGEVELRPKMDKNDETYFILCTKCCMWFEKFIYRARDSETIIAEWNERVSG